eukprot:3662943-Alexandrium_andersonii.AAC.1
MSASLVGSEMCIRDSRRRGHAGAVGRLRCLRSGCGRCQRPQGRGRAAAQASTRRPARQGTFGPCQARSLGAD